MDLITYRVILFPTFEALEVCTSPKSLDAHFKQVPKSLIHGKVL